MSTELTLKHDGWRTCTCDAGGSAGCVVHDIGADDATVLPNGEKQNFEYTVLYVSPDGTLCVEWLDGLSAAHAYDEAWHECEGKVIAVRRGDSLGYST